MILGLSMVSLFGFPSRLRGMTFLTFDPDVCILCLGLRFFYYFLLLGLIPLGNGSIFAHMVIR